MTTKYTKAKRTLFAIAAIALSAIASCNNHDEKKDTEKVVAVPVTMGVAGRSTGNEIEASGQIKPEQTAYISSRVMGTITRIHVKVGDKVSKGQALVNISSPDMISKRAQTEASIAEAEAAFGNAQKDYERFNNLYKKQSASAKELDNITLQYNAAKSRLEAARQMRNEVNNMIGYTSISAPFNGVVTQRMADEGNTANPGMPLLIIEQNGVLEANAMLSESVISAIKKGQLANIYIKAIAKNIQSTVSAISPSGSATGGLYQVTFNIPAADQKGLYSGMYVNISIPVLYDSANIQTDKGSLFIPVDAVVKKEQLSGIYTVSHQQTAIFRLVRTGRISGDKIEILSGLSANESFILRAEGKLYNGVPVQVK